MSDCKRRKTCSTRQLFSAAVRSSHSHSASDRTRMRPRRSRSGWSRRCQAATLRSENRCVGAPSSPSRRSMGRGVGGRPFELLLEDEEANPPVAVRKSEKLLQQDKVDLLTGTVNSGSTLAVGQVAERNNRILVTTVSYAPSI